MPAHQRTDFKRRIECRNMPTREEAKTRTPPSGTITLNGETPFQVRVISILGLASSLFKLVLFPQRRSERDPDQETFGGEKSAYDLPHGSLDFG